MKITLKNYRCFPDERPAVIDIRPGFTALLGTNNSGKSALLKFFVEFRGLFSMLSSLDATVLTVYRGGQQGFPLAAVSDISEIFCNTNDRGLVLEFELAPQPAQRVPAKIVVRIPRGSNTFTANIVPPPATTAEMQNVLVSGTSLMSPRNDVVAELGPFLTQFSLLSQSFYIGPFRNAINIGTNQSYFDIQVGQAFIQQWRRFKNGNVKRENHLIQKVTEDLEHIFDFERLEVDVSTDETTLQVYINRKSYKLQELGSGLAQFLLVLSNTAIRNPVYVLIDEPELNLHPSLMLDFLTTLSSYCKPGGGVVFSTHSIGLARAAAERIYSLRKVSEGDSQIATFETTPWLSELLGELSFSGYQDLGYTTILLVEGRTDVKTVQQWLRLFKMDHKVVLLPLGGKTLIHSAAREQLEEIKRISPNVLALIDSERESAGAVLEAERQGFVNACGEAGVVCHVLERRAIENYFPEHAIKKAKGNEYRELAPFEKLNAMSPTWGKLENWRIAREMTIGDLNGTDLGRFLDILCAAKPTVRSEIPTDASAQGQS